jgi:REP element-mobilizing transposase RayT
MPKRKVKFAQGCYYHIYNRGAGKQSILRREQDYVDLLWLMKDLAVECCITIIAYCLLPNHYHWLVRQDGEITPAKLVGRVFGSYSQSFNLTYQRSGTLFEGPYEAILVDTDEYLRHLCCYIHANPVRHGLAMDPTLWPYSNYLEWLGQRQGTMVDRAFIQSHFPDISHYQARVHSYLTGQVTLPAGLRHYLASLE